MERHEIERRSVAAKELIENDLFKEAIEKLETEYTRLAVDAATVDEREDARKYVQVVRALAGHIQAVFKESQWLMENENE